MDQQIVGHYAGPGGGFSIVRAGIDVLMRFPGVPSGFEPRLVGEGDSWVIEGGDYEGSALTFTEEGIVAGGALVFQRTDQAPTVAPGSGLPAPEYVEDPRCEELWAVFVGEGSVLDLPEDLPVHRFVQWLMRRGGVIFHGTGSADIEAFRPRRASTELNDQWGRGNLAAVYGTHDGLWAMFYAILDRERIRGSIRNGVQRFTDPQGRFVDLYNFSISSASLPEAPWSDGALYLLPSDRFTRLERYPGGPLTAEWASAEEVRPLAHLVIRPEDFPFLDQIGGHDDTRLLDLDDLWPALRRATRHREELTGGFRLEVVLDAAVVERWADLMREFYPQATIETDQQDDRVVIDVWGPPALLDVHSRP